MKLVLAMYKYKSASLIMNFAGGLKNVILTDFYAAHPKKGHGSRLLAEVTAYCDELGATVLLEARSGNPKMSNSKLRELYERFGFVRIGKSNMMKRKPKK